MALRQALALPAHAQSGNSPSRANSKSNAKTSAKPAPKVEDDLPVEPKQPVDVRVEGEAKPVAPKVTEIEGSLDDVLGDVDLDFDD